MRILTDVEASKVVQNINTKFAEIERKVQEVETWIKAQSSTK